MNLYHFFLGLENKIELVVIVLLCVTIYYAIKLNGRLSVLRANRGEFETLARQIVEAVSAAEGSMAQIRLTAGKTVDGLHAILNQSTGLRDELNFMLERSDLSIERLEKLLQNAREHEKKFLEDKDKERNSAAGRKKTASPKAPVQRPSVEKKPVVIEEEKPRSKKEEELLNALKSLR
ncbi:MAG: DUF6468 domain-containing protein [Alphaproteobacteria bacterium]